MKAGAAHTGPRAYPLGKCFLCFSASQHQQMLLCSLALRSRRIAARADKEAAVAAENAVPGKESFLLQAAPRASAKMSITASKRSAGVGTAHSVSHKCTLADLLVEYTLVCKSQVRFCI